MRLRLRPFEPHRAPQSTPAQSPSTQSRPTDPSSGPIWYQSSSWKPILGAGRSNHEVVRGEILDRAVAAPTLGAHPQSGDYGKGGRESFLSSVTAIQTKNTGQPSSPCANRHVSTSLNIQHWAFPLHPLLRLICDGPDRPRKTPCCCVRIYNPVIVFLFHWALGKCPCPLYRSIEYGDPLHHS